MAGLRSLTTGIAALAALLPLVSAQCQGVTARFQPKLASGYNFSALATGLGTPRGIVIDSEDNLLVTQQAGGSVMRLVLEEQGNIVCIKSYATLIQDGSTNHGIQLSADGKTLFTSNLQSVTAYSYDAAAGTVGTGKVIVTGLGNAGPHPTRTLLASKTHPGLLYVARGSNNNIDAGTTDKAQGRCMIKAFNISDVMTTPAQYATGGEIVGWGLRNIVGMGEDPSGGLWSVENSLDDTTVGGRDVHNDNPAERMNYHGVWNDTSNALKGANFGYPSCFAAWEPSLFANAQIKVGDLFNPDRTPQATDCDSRQKPSVLLPPHTAPLDIKFTPDGSTAYISLHGSWDRQPPDGYRVVKVNFKDGKPVEPYGSKTASIPILENPNTGSCPLSCFRPVGLDFDSKGRLYMSSDQSGEVYVIYGA